MQLQYRQVQRKRSTRLLQVGNNEALREWSNATTVIAKQERFTSVYDPTPHFVNNLTRNSSKRMLKKFIEYQRYSSDKIRYDRENIE